MGVVDEENCNCCMFADYSKYSDLLSQLQGIEESFINEEIPEDIQNEIEDLRSILSEVIEEVISTCGNTPDEAISGFFGAFEQKLDSLAITVSEFDFSFDPNVCTIECDEENGYVPVYEDCECKFLEGYADFYAAKMEFIRVYSALKRSLFDTVEYNQILEQFNLEYSELSQVEFNIQNRWSQYTLEEMYAMMAEIVTVSQSFTYIDTYVNRVHGSCANTCDYSLVPKAVESCSCYQTVSIFNFYTLFEQFILLELSIRSWSYYDDLTNEEYFTEWVARIREQCVTFYSNIVESLYDETAQQTEVDLILAEFSSCLAEWEAYAVVETCDIECTGDTVKSCGSCECIDVTGWGILSTIFEEIDAVISEIAELDTEEANKVTLTNNANNIKDGITSVVNYVTNSCTNLDIAQIITSVVQLTTNYQILTTEITTIQESTSVCSIACPDAWDIDLDACSCNCPEFECAGSIPDPYNCNCAADNGCTLTNDQCTQTPNTYLNYADCECQTAT